MCCKEERKLFLKKRTISLRSQEEKKSMEQKCVAGMVPLDDGTAAIRRKRVSVSEHSCNVNGSGLATPLTDRSRRRIQRQRRPVSDDTVARHLEDGRENLWQWNINDLPLDVLVCIICKVSHDELSVLSHVSRKFREAVLTATQVHFDFTTPSRTRAWSTFNLLNCDADVGNGRFWPPTPNAPRNTRKRLTDEEIREVAVTLSSLFEDDEINSVWPRLPSNRALFTEEEFGKEELCVAAA